MKIVHRVARKVRSILNHDIYRKLYEAHAALNPEPEAVGSGPYDLIGKIELDLLRTEGLVPSHTLFDLGCGNGRLAVHAVPYLIAGAYIGTDVSGRLLAEAQERLSQRGGPGQCKVTWQVQKSVAIALPDQSVDVMCAFSVFTHIEHEDTFQYLLEARRVVRPGGKFVFSCLPLELPAAQDEFRKQASLEFGKRWAQVRNIVTSRDLINEMARMAGWEVVRWYAGNEQNIHGTDGTPAALGQSSCILSVPQLK